MTLWTRFLNWTTRFKKVVHDPALDQKCAEIDRQVDRGIALHGARIFIDLGDQRITPDRVRKPLRLSAKQIQAIHFREQWGAEYDKAGEVWEGDA